jgi:hypothetical protein
MVGRKSNKRAKRRRQDSPPKIVQQHQQQHNGYQQYSEKMPTPLSTTNEPSPQREQSQSEHHRSQFGAVSMTHNAHDRLPGNIVFPMEERSFEEFHMFDQPGISPNMSTTHGNTSSAVQSAPTNMPPVSLELPSVSLELDYSLAFNHESMLAIGSSLPDAVSISSDLLQHAYGPGVRSLSSGDQPDHRNAGASIKISEHSSLGQGGYSDVVGDQSPQTLLSFLTKILNDLETGVRSAGQVRMDARLMMSRKAMADLRIVIRKESFKTCGSCIVLVASTLDLILENYGYIVDALKSEDNTDAGEDITGEGELTSLATPPPTTTTTPISYSNQSVQCPRAVLSGDCPFASTMQLRIGCYELSQEDQISLRNHVIRKELHRCIEIARICASFSQSIGRNSFANHERVRASLQADTEACAYRLMASMDEQGEKI